MDQITVTKLVSDRTDDLRRTAEQVRQERALRSTTTSRSEAVALPRRPAEERRSPASARDCAPAEPAL